MKVIIDINGKDVTNEFIQGTQLCLNLGIEADSAFAILKSKSLSCGLSTVYDGSFKRKLQNGDGTFAYLYRILGMIYILS